MTSFVKDLKEDNTNPCVRRVAVDAFDRVCDRDGFTVTDGVMRWDSNNAVPPVEWVELAAWVFPDEVDVQKCTRAREVDMDRAIAAYREGRRNMTTEQRMEERMAARAAHGPGVELVDIFTGETYVT